MARRVQFSREEIQRAKQLRDQSSTIAEYRKALSVLMVAELGLDADGAAEILGISRRTIFRNRSNICSQDDTVKNSWGGRRHCSMTVEEESEFLAQWQEKAMLGGVLVDRKIQMTP